jgi:two-component system sensor histidine kinase ChiS
VLYRFLYCIALILLFACSKKNQEGARDPLAAKVISLKPYILSKDSVTQPPIVLAGKPVTTQAGQARVTLTNLNIHMLRERPEPVDIKTKPKPLTVTFSNDSFKVNKNTRPHPKIVTAGLPDVVEAKDPASKDQNPANFTFFKVQQGLKQSMVRSLYQDRDGAIWVGTYSGGVSRYDGKFFSHFTEEKGLSNNVVFCILQDKKGNMWFGTNGGGVSCYDGKTFTHFTEADGLKSNAVYSMLEDKKGRIWIGTSAGLNSYDGKTIASITYDQLNNGPVFSIFEDKNQRLWFGTHNNGVICYDARLTGATKRNRNEQGSSLTNFTKSQGLSENLVLSIGQDKKGNLWFGTVSGASCFDGKSFINYSTTQGLGGNVIYNLLCDSNGNIWFGTEQGLSSFNGTSFTNYNESQGLSHNVIYSIIEDRSGNLWLGTGNGLDHYGGKSFTFASDVEGLGNNIVLAVQEDNNGKIWFGTYGGGISCYDGASFKTYTRNQGLGSNVVYSIVKDTRGNLWIGTDDGGVQCFDGTKFTTYTEEQGLNKNTVYTILQDKKGNMWFGSEGNGASCFDGKSFTHYSEKQGLCNNTVYYMLEDKKGNIWFATYNGISCYNGKFFTNYKDSSGGGNDLIYSILEDSNGNIWFGSNSGLRLYDGKTFICFTEAQGLSNNAVLNLLEDTAGNLWIGTRMGLNKVERNNLKQLAIKNNSKVSQKKEALFFNYGYNDGFLGINCRRNSVLQDSKGNIWWGADKLTHYTPTQHKTDASPASVHITDVKLFEENILWDKLFSARIDSAGNELINEQANDTLLGNGVELKDIRQKGLNSWYNLPIGLSLPYNNNNLSFKFIGVHLQGRDHIKYQYMLQGYDKKWGSVTKRTEASYGNLPPGEYKFQVKAMNPMGIWSNTVAYGFKIRAPWWQTWWFRILTIVATLLIIALYIRWRELESRKTELKLQRQNTQLLKTNAELDRFVYSASHELRSPLTSVMGLINLSKLKEDNNEKLQRLNMMQTAIQRLDSFIANIVDHSRNSRLRVGNEVIDFVQIINESIEQHNYMPEREKIKINISVKDNYTFYSDRERIRTIFNNLLSNAIKYHSTEKENPFIDVVVKTENEKTYITVKDNGIGIPAEYAPNIFGMFYRATEKKAGSGLGLYIVKEILNKLNGSIHMESLEGKGTAFFVTIPSSKT